MHDPVIHTYRQRHRINRKVREVSFPVQEANRKSQNHIIVKTHQQDHQIYMRILADHQPYPHAHPVLPDLDDYYLYHFNEGSD